MKLTNLKKFNKNNLKELNNKLEILKKSNPRLETLKNKIIKGYLYDSLDEKIDKQYLNYFKNRNMDCYKIYTQEIYFPLIEYLLNENIKLEKEDIDYIINNIIEFSSFKELKNFYEKGMAKFIRTEDNYVHLIDAAFSCSDLFSKKERFDKLNLVLNYSNDLIIDNGYIYKKIIKEFGTDVLKELLKNDKFYVDINTCNILIMKNSTYKELKELYKKGLSEFLDKEKISEYLISASNSSYIVSSKEERLDKMKLILNNSKEKVIANSYLLRHIMQEFGTDALKDFMKNDKFYIDSFSSIGLPKEIYTELCDLIFEKGGNKEEAIQFNQRNRTLLKYLKEKGYDTTSKYKNYNLDNSHLKAKINKKKKFINNFKHKNKNNLEM